MITLDTSNEILFESLDYGAYFLDYESGLYEENVKFAGAEFNKLYVRKVRLPDGKANAIFLLSDTFEGTLAMTTGQNFIAPPSYRQFFYPWMSYGTFMGRRYKMNVVKDKKSRVELITTRTKLRPVGTRSIGGMIGNFYICTSDIYQAVKPIMDQMTAKKNYSSFFKSFTDIIIPFAPKADEKKKGDPDWNNRILMIDADRFRFDASAPLKDNKSNPLYMFYLAFMRNKDLKGLGADMDMLICAKNLFIKFNPTRTSIKDWPMFRKALFRIMNVDLDKYTDDLTAEEKDEIELTVKDQTVAGAINSAIEPFTQMASPSTKALIAGTIEKKLTDTAKAKVALNDTIRDEQKAIAQRMGTSDPTPKQDDIFTRNLPKQPTSILHTDPAKSIFTPKQDQIFRAVSGYQPLGTLTGQVVDDEDDDDFEKPVMDPDELGQFADEVEADATEILTQDEEIVAAVLDEIQDKTAPLDNPKTAPINSARDKKLREEQKKVTVKNSTIEQVLAREASQVPLKTTDKSKVMHTTNPNMQQMTFANFTKTYLDELYVKDLVACLDMLKDKESPFYITGIEVRDSSTNMDLKETWTVHLVDENKKRHTIKVDIPKFQNDRFMWINGTKWIILNQNLYNPLVKDTPDTIILTTNFNKITIRRKATKSLGTIERIFSLIRKAGDQKVFVTGDSSRGNMKYISSLEYDEISRRLFKFSSNGCEICFSRDFIKDNLSDQIPADVKGDEFFIGVEGGVPILINEDTGLDRRGRTISEIIEENLSEEYRAIYKSTKPPAQSMYAEAKLAGAFIPVVATLIVWEGITKTLKRMGIFWKFDPNAKKVPPNTSSRKYIRFADGVLEYESKVFSELIMNGIMKMHPEKFRFEDFDSEVGYGDFIYSQWGSFNGITQLKTFYEFLVDPITKDVCRDLYFPDDPSGLMIHAVKLLCDNTHVSKANDGSYRVRSIEMIPAILYSCIARQYNAYVRSGRRLPMTLNQKCVINELLSKKTVEAYSTLNPVIEVSKAYTISTKGYKGSNSDRSYDEEKRSYDPSAVGKIAISTSADANVGINRFLVIEPTLSNARGYRQQVQDEGELKDVNIFSPVEMLTPGTSRNDDPIRTAIAGKQSQHVVPVADAAPALVSNGFDEAVQFHLSDDFVINADEDGKVIDVNDELGFIVVQYKSGKTRAINTNPEVVKNSGGGFYMSNRLTPTVTKVGQTFKKDEPLAYHPNYFKYSKMNGLRYAVGPIVKMALMSSYNTYEDAGICTAKLAERMKTAIVYLETGKFKRNNNILSMVKVGDHVNIGDPLIKFDVSVEDNELAKYLTKLSEENAELLEEETKNEIKTSHAGEVIAIKVYTLLDPSNLSPSLGKVVQQYFDRGNSKKKFLEQYDGSEGIMKAGYMLTDSTEPVKNQYNSIKGNKGLDVLIEIYIEHPDVMGVGDKIALYGPNKQIVSEVIPEGWEPYSEFRPDEEISVMTSPGTIARRMTPAVIPVSAAMKCMIELKRKIAKEIKYK